MLCDRLSQLKHSQVVTILRVNAVTGGSRWPVILLELLMVINMVPDVYICTLPADEDTFLISLC